LTLYAQFFARAFRLSFREADWQSFFSLADFRGQ